MTNKAILLMSLASVCSGVLVDYHGKVTKDGAASSTGHPHKWELVKVLPPTKEHLWYKYGAYAYPKYEFEYAVSDHHTGDHKRHKESRDGDHVQGEYSLIEPDGSLRKVQYSADDHTGFNAIVSKTMHKHGDNAFSFTGHTRHFLPVGHGQKSNLYTHHAYQMIHEEPNKLSDHIAFKPVAVKAPKDMKVVKIEDMKSLPVVVISENAGDNTEATSEEISANAMTNSVAMPVDTINVEAPVAAQTISDQNNSLTMTMQEVMAYIMAAQSKQGQLGEMKSLINEVTAPNVPNDEMPQPQNVPVIEMVSVDEKKEGDQPEPVPDSSAASSYYRSHVYYLGY